MSELTMPKKIAYATGGLAMNLTNLVIAQWALKRYVPTPATALVPVAIFSLVLMAGRFADAITDPLVAFWSDRLRSRHGRRVPFIALGVIPFALVFFLIWVPPLPGLHWANTLFAFVLVQLYFVLYAVVITPYLALLPEVTSDLKERVNISTLQAVFVMVGTIVFGFIGVVVEKSGWAAMGLLVAGLTVISFLPTVLWIREKPQPTHAESSAVIKGGIVTWIKLTLANRPFIHLVIATSLYWFGLNLLIMLVPFWVQDFLHQKESAVTLLMAPFLGTNAVFFVVFNILAKRYGKHLVFLLCILGSALAAPLLSAVGSLALGSPLLQSGIALGIIGVPVAGFMMLPFALLADVVDYDAQLTGQRREGIYFGVQAIFQKSTIGLSNVVFGVVVLAQGAEASVAGMRLIPLIAAVAFLLGLVAFVRYPLRERAGGVVCLERAAPSRAAVVAPD